VIGDFGSEVRHLLKAAGCEPERAGKGSHEIWYSPISNRSFPVPHRIKSRHTANAILKQAGLEKAF